MHTRKMKAYALPLLLLLCAASATPQQRTITSVRGRAVLSAVDYSFERENERSFKLDLDKMDPAELRRIFAERRKRVMKSIPDGAMLIFSVEQAQLRRLEF